MDKTKRVKTSEHRLDMWRIKQSETKLMLAVEIEK